MDKIQLTQRDSSSYCLVPGGKGRARREDYANTLDQGPFLQLGKAYLAHHVLLAIRSIARLKLIKIAY